jgi:hypothetical protein
MDDPDRAGDAVGGGGATTAPGREALGGSSNGEVQEVPPSDGAVSASPFESLRDELYRKLLAEDPDHPQAAITLATLYARFETEVPQTMGQLRGLLATLDGVFGGGKSSKLLGLLGVGKS